MSSDDSRHRVLTACGRSELAPVDLALVGSDVEVPLVTGGWQRYVNLDYAASAPCLVSVKQAVDELLPWYSSVHRGAGFKSQLATAAYEESRDAVRSFVGGRPDDAVIFTRNTTDALNLLAAALPPEAEVFVFAAEHHANLLPWRRGHLTVLPVPASPADALDELDRALEVSARGPRLVAVTGASNVTGEIWPYPQIARLAHEHDARILLDAAQLAPHHILDLNSDDIDYLAMSGHKLYAPFGAGALIGRPDWLAAREPFLAGGGAVRYVSVDQVLWADLPDRQEAGSPNVIGAVALGVACRTLQAADMTRRAASESALLGLACSRLAAVPGLQQYQMWGPDHPRIAVLTFALTAASYSQVAAVLSAEYGIGLRHGCFCAHPLMARLLGINPAQEANLRHYISRGVAITMPGAVRASMGIGTTAADIEHLAAALTAVVIDGPRWSYHSSADGTDCWPEPDPRPQQLEALRRTQLPAGR